MKPLFRCTVTVTVEDLAQFLKNNPAAEIELLNGKSKTRNFKTPKIPTHAMLTRGDGRVPSGNCLKASQVFTKHFALSKVASRKTLNEILRESGVINKTSIGPTISDLIKTGWLRQA